MLDLLAQREPFKDNAKRIFSLVDLGKATAVVASISFATAAYILEKKYPEEEIANVLRNFSPLVEIASVDEKVIRKSLSSSLSDIEDAMQHFAATQSECNLIITRNVKDFKYAEIPVLSPKDFLK